MDYCGRYEFDHDEALSFAVAKMDAALRKFLEENKENG